MRSRGHHRHNQHEPDSHGHDHEGHQDDSYISRLGHAIGEVFGAHSHDSNNQIDEALEANAEGRHALIISLAVLLATALLQGVVVVFSGSVALLGDTLHNVADALTAVPLLIAFRLALRPATKRFTYGYGRAEDLAGIFVVAMIALSSAVAAYEAINRLINPQQVTHLWAVGAAAIIGFAGNELVATYRIRVGRRIGSAALVADGLHARTDGLTSLAVLFGVVGVALGWKQADPIVGLLITITIIAILRSAITQVGGRLMDAIDPALVEQGEEILQSFDGVHSVDDMRMRWIGHALSAEVSLTVSSSLTLEEAHSLTHVAEKALKTQLRRLDRVVIHAGPSETPKKA